MKAEDLVKKDNIIESLYEEIESANERGECRFRCSPYWYMQAKGLIDYIKWRNYTDDFVELMDILDKDFSNVYIMVEEKL